ncbi:TorF family putative porin [Luteimonas sp. TWI1416]|uniref:TorF family putative porin n=1 Tax=unclassified Luteimonas TaxID=2629088 RepID=UPI00320A3986
MDRRAVTPRRVALSLALLVSSVGSVAATELSGSATLTSDYVWRGTSQSDEGPAVQAGIKFTGMHGFYAQAWGSDVRFAPQTAASHELDLVAGWAGPLSDAFALDAALTHRERRVTSGPLCCGFARRCA